MNEAKIKSDIRGWICKKSNHNNLENLNDETQIIEKRIISSVQLMDLIMYLESLMDESINVNHLKPGAFNSVNCIYTRFFIK